MRTTGMSNRATDRFNHWVLWPLGLIVLLLGTSDTLAQPVTSNPCQKAEILRRSGFLEAAETAYLAITASDLSCVESGLRHLAEDYRTRGRSYLSAGEFTEATQALRRALALQPQNKSVRDDLLALSGEKRFESARRLLEIGAADDARKKVLEVLGESNGRSVPSDLAILFTSPLPRWDGVRRTVWRWSTTFEEVALVLVSLLLLFYLSWRLLREPQKLQIQAFESAGADSMEGTRFAGLISVQLMQLAQGQISSEPMRIVSEVEAVTLPTVASTISPLSQSLMSSLLDLVRRLLPPPLKLTGVLHAEGPDGRGVTLQLHRGTSLLVTDTIWEGDYTPIDRLDSKTTGCTFALLAEMLAVHVLFDLRKHPSRWSRIRQFFSQATPREFRFLGTPVWCAVALFRAGVRAMEQARERPKLQAEFKQLARYRFVKALQEDSDIYPAHVWLARLHWEDDPVTAVRELSTALAILRREHPEPQLPLATPTDWVSAEEALERVATGQLESKVDPQLRGCEEQAAHYYEIRYGLFALKVVYVIQLVTPPIDGPRPFVGTHPETQAFDEAVILVAELENTAQKLHRRIGDRKYRGNRQRDQRSLQALRRLAEVIHPILVALELFTAEEPDAKKHLKLLKRRASRSFNGLFAYNVAYLYSIVADNARKKKKDLCTPNGLVVEEVWAEAAEILEWALVLDPHREQNAARGELLSQLLVLRQDSLAAVASPPTDSDSKVSSGGWLALSLGCLALVPVGLALLKKQQASPERP